MAQAEYEVKVAGVVSAHQLRDVGAVSAAEVYPSTVLYGEIADEEELFQLLARLRALGLELVEVHRTPALVPTRSPDDPS